MAVYFEPRGRNWMDYVAPVVGELLGGVINQGFEKSRQARDYEYAQKAADADMMRKRGQSEWLAGQLGYAPGTLDMRGSPDASMYQLAAIKSLVPEFEMDDALKSLNPNMQFQALDQGDRITAGGFNPGTGAFDSREFGVGIDPAQLSKQEHEREILAQEQKGTMDLAKFNVANRPPRVAAAPRPPRPELVQDSSGQYVYISPGGTSPTGVTGNLPQPKGSALRVVQTDQGIALLNPDTGEISPTGFSAPPKGGGGLSLEDLIANGPDAFGGSPKPASAADDPIKLLPPGMYQDFKNNQYSDDEIRAWALKNYKR